MEERGKTSRRSQFEGRERQGEEERDERIEVSDFAELLGSVVLKQVVVRDLLELSEMRSEKSCSKGRETVREQR